MVRTRCSRPTEEAGEAFDPDLTKAEASRRIDALQAKTGRGRRSPRRQERMRRSASVRAGAPSRIASR
ncbi:MAG TPA: DUF3072 domain-containing protein [Falsiroseomonas sp.]|nr:DUF3072 domain-containing protein [Falsiroseomonas sp.]